MYSATSHFNIERILRIVAGEKYFFGNGDLKEYDKGYDRRVGLYWNLLDYELDGNNRDWPWSAAFISYVMYMSGTPFHRSIRHCDYINYANDNPYYLTYGAMNIDECIPQLGDMVCYSREGYQISLLHMPKLFKAHCDIVTGRGTNTIEVTGGNVSNSVTTKVLEIDKEGFLVDKSYKWFAILQHEDNRGVQI